jgi:hypothetical protein
MCGVLLDMVPRDTKTPSAGLEEITRMFSGLLVMGVGVTDGARHILDTSYSYRRYYVFSFFVVLLVLATSATGDTRGLDAAHGILLDASQSLAYKQLAMPRKKN